MYTVYSAGTQAFTGWRVYFSTESRNRMFYRWSKRAMHVQMRSTLGLTRRLHFPGRIGKCGSHAISRLFSLAPSSLDCLLYLRYNSVPICLPSAFSSRRLDAYTHALKTSLSSPLPPSLAPLLPRFVKLGGNARLCSQPRALWHETIESDRLWSESRDMASILTF